MFGPYKRKEKKYVPVRYGNVKPIDIHKEGFRFNHIYDIMPRPEAIPKEFIGSPGYNKWVEIFNQWFYQGLRQVEFIPWEDIDGKIARAHVFACVSSWDGKHENKELGCAYLMNEFFKDIEYKK